MRFNSLRIALALVFVGGVCGLYGALMERYNLFPKPQIKMILGTFLPEPTGRDATGMSMIFTDLKISRIAISGMTGAGAISTDGHRILGTDRRGNFFLLSHESGSQPRVEPLEIEIETKYSDFLTSAAKRDLDVNESWFRVHDILWDPVSQRIFASHHVWDGKRECVIVRISVAQIPADFEAKSFRITADDWQLVYDSHPCIGFQTAGNPFEGLQAGARLALYSKHELLVTMGDHGLDGWDGAADEPQSLASSYGKVWLIDLEDGAVRPISIGHRNPQGLLVDDQGRIWVTEHGPKGGDELNLVREGKNFGWPEVTYGAQYGLSKWPRTSDAEQGRHSGYDPATFVWVNSIGVSQLIQISNFIPSWNGDLLIGSLGAGTLHRLRYEDDQVRFVQPIRLRTRIRDLTQLLDGTIVAWSDSGEIIQLTPAEPSDNVGEGPSSLGSENGPLVAAALEACLDCHPRQMGANGQQAPTLWGVYDRQIASTDYPSYSDALLRYRDRSWDRDSLDSFLENPQRFAPGSTMVYRVTEPAMRAGIIDYLESLK